MKTFDPTLTAEGASSLQRAGSFSLVPITQRVASECLAGYVTPEIERLPDALAMLPTAVGNGAVAPGRVVPFARRLESATF